MKGEYMTLETAELRHKCKILKRENDDLKRKIHTILRYTYNNLPMGEMEKILEIIRGVER